MKYRFTPHGERSKFSGSGYKEEKAEVKTKEFKPKSKKTKKKEEEVVEVKEDVKLED